MLIKSVGLSTYRQEVKWSRWDMTASLVGYDYIDLVVTSGLNAVLLPPVIINPTGLESLVRIAEKATFDEISDFQLIFEQLINSTKTYIDQLLDSVAGLILIGGEDVCPLIYGQLPNTNTGHWNLVRDVFEIALVRVSMQRDLPILAICRGHQVLNVACGGTLIQHIPDRIVGNIDHTGPASGQEFNSEIKVNGGKFAKNVYESPSFVKCFHHQAIDELGLGLITVALGQDGVIEAVESESHKFVLGLQWHPEKAGDLKPFDEFAKAILD